MSMAKYLKVANTDNRDIGCTNLVLGEPGKAGSIYTTEVNPTDMYRNALENLNPVGGVMAEQLLKEIEEYVTEADGDVGEMDQPDPIQRVLDFCLYVQEKYKS